MSMSPFGGISSLMFSVVPVIVTLGFFLVFGIIIVRGIQGAKQWKKNNDSPVLTVYAAAAAKRTAVHHHHNTAGNMPHTTTSTTYYVTFEVESGDRMEFKVRGEEYGQIAEGDAGKLTFQGTRYLGFERLRKQG
jgi:hypothetical protein